MVLRMLKPCSNPDKNGECTGIGTKYKGLGAVAPDGKRTHMNLCPSCDEKRNARLRSDREYAKVAWAFSPENPENQSTTLTRTDSFMAGHQKGDQNPPEQLTLF